MSKENIEVYECSYADILPIEEITPNPINRNKHQKEQISRLAKIIKYQGQRSPIVISTRSGLIVKGHGRLEALKELGWKYAAVDYQDYEDDEQEYADMVADNAVAAWAELQLEDIQKDALELGPMDLELLGVKDFFLPNVTTDGPEPEGKPVPKCVICPSCGVEFDPKG